jgi:hypothetical protein
MDVRRGARVVRVLVVAVAAASLVAAGPADVVEVEDGCGADTHVLGTGAPHPTPEATDIDTVDLRGAYVGDLYVGLDVVLTTCGDELDLSTRERVAVGWQTEDGDVTGCDATSSFLTFDRDVASAEFHATLGVNCVVYGDCSPPLGLGACGSATVTDIVDVPLTGAQFERDGRTFTARLRLPDLDATVAETLQAGHLLEHVYIHGSSFAGAYVALGTEDGLYHASLIDRGSGLDHRLGADAP